MPIYEVGKRYLVPAVKGTWVGRFDLWPIIGPRHEDTDFIGFEQDHWHVDVRFFDSRQWAFALRQPERPFQFVITAPTSPLGLVRLQCRRQWPAYPRHRPRWLAALSSHFANHRLGEKRVCPHRGADLSTFAPDADGCITCPLHGLRWNVETGCIVPPPAYVPYEEDYE